MGGVGFPVGWDGRALLVLGCVGTNGRACDSGAPEWMGPDEYEVRGTDAGPSSVMGSVLAGVPCISVFSVRSGWRWRRSERGVVVVE